MSSASRQRRRGALGTSVRVVGIAALALFMALLVYGLASKPGDETIDTSLSEGEAPPAPGFELALLERGRVPPMLDARLRRAFADGQLALEELRGIPVVLNFWASWCPPCREEAPRLETAWQRDGRGGVLFLGIDMQDLTGDARDFIDEFEISYPNVRDPGDEVARQWGVTGFPETFFVSARGRVVGHVIGAASKDQLTDGVRAAPTGQPLPPQSGGDRRTTR